MHVDTTARVSSLTAVIEAATRFREPRLLRSGRVRDELRRQERRRHDDGAVRPDAARFVRARRPRLRRLQGGRSAAGRLEMLRQAIMHRTHSRLGAGPVSALSRRTQDLSGSQLHLCTRYRMYVDYLFKIPHHKSET